MPAAFAATGAVGDDDLHQQRCTRFQTTSQACVSWLEQPGNIWGELVNKSKVGLNGTLQHCPQQDSDSAKCLNSISAMCSSNANLGRNVSRPRSCPGGTCSVTTIAPSDGAAVQRPSANGGRCLSESLLGLEVYCSSMHLAVNKKLRRNNSGKRCSSAGGRRTSHGSASNEQAPVSLAAYVPLETRKTGSSRPNSSGGSHAAAHEQCQASASYSCGDAGRAVDLALSLRERVLQLERRNRVLEKKLKLFKQANAQQDSSAQSQQVANTELKQQQQQQVRVHSTPHLSLQVCMLPTHDVAPQQAGSTVSLLLPPATPTASASNSSDGIAADADGSIDMQPPMECDVALGSALCPSEEHSSSSSSSTSSSCLFQPEQLGVESGLDSINCELPPPRTPELLSLNGSSSISATIAALTSEQEQQQHTIESLQHQLKHMQMLHGLLENDHADLQFVLKETEKQRREYATRYAFVVIDSDGDGYISIEQAERYEPFACYAPQVLRAAFAAWRWQSGFPGFLNIEDFVRFVDYAEDRSSLQAERFWFSVLDTDGDGHLGWQDMKVAYDAVEKSSAHYVVTFEDLMNQIRDMVSQQQDPRRGFTFSELRASKLGPGVIGLLTNHNNMLLQRSTTEWGRGEYPL